MTHMSTASVDRCEKWTARTSLQELKVKKVLVLSGLFIFLFIGLAFADQVYTLYYHKTLTLALTTSTKMIAVNVTFSLYDAKTGGNLLWSETKLIEADSATRVITTNLGDTNPLSVTDFKPQMWVQVSTTNNRGIKKVHGSRDILAGAPYALWSASGTPGP